MNGRVCIDLDEAEEERFRRRAEREGKSLAAWLHEAARERGVTEERAQLGTLEQLRALFDTCHQRETGRNPIGRSTAGSSSARSAPTRDT